MAISETLLAFKHDFDRVLENFFDRRIAEYGSIDPILTEMLELLSRQALRGGKRVRPFLCYLGYRLGGGVREKKILKACITVELVHQFLLIHDDIADRDEQRRGELSLHLTYEKLLEQRYHRKNSHLGEALAMGAGNLLYSLARQALYESDFPPKRIVEGGIWISEYLTKTVAGWAMQFYQLNQTIGKIDEADYLKATTLVNAYYAVEGPMVLGFILAGNSDRALRTMVTQYAIGVGTAFQIRDDILGMFGDTKQIGKPVGNDFREGKKTSLIIRAYNQANDSDKRFLEEKIGTLITAAELKQVQTIIQETGALDQATKLARDYVEKGKAALQTVDGNKHTLQLLKELADFVVEREK